MLFVCSYNCSRTHTNHTPTQAPSHTHTQNDMLSALRSSVPESHRWHLLEHAGRFIRGVQQRMHVHAPLHTPPLLHVCTQLGAEERWVGFGSIHHCAVNTLTHASNSSSKYSTSQQQEQHRIWLDSIFVCSYNCSRTHANYTPIFAHTYTQMRTGASRKMRIVTYIYPHITHTHTHTHKHKHTHTHTHTNTHIMASGMRLVLAASKYKIGIHQDMSYMLSR